VKWRVNQISGHNESTTVYAS